MTAEIIPFPNRPDGQSYDLGRSIERHPCNSGRVVTNNLAPPGSQLIEEVTKVPVRETVANLPQARAIGGMSSRGDFMVGRG